MNHLTPPEPILTAGLFAPDRAALVELLASLTPEEWARPTACAGWTVHDVALHLLGGDLSNLSRRRDGHRATEPRPGENIATFVNRINEEWVAAARRISPRLTTDLLDHLATALADYFASLDPYAIGAPVSWAGPDPAPTWLDVAREYTERWLHQQHIRDAVGRPGQRERRFFAPVLATFVHALPAAGTGRAGGALVVSVDGPSGGTWTVVDGRLYQGAADGPKARVTLAEDDAWRLFTRGLTPEEARARARVDGDPALAETVFGAVAIIA